VAEDVRPDLDASFIGLAVADYVHIRLGKLDNAFFLQLLDRLNDSCNLVNSQTRQILNS
jgi:hypothetical protein